jgi:hypothetical protein
MIIALFGISCMTRGEDILHPTYVMMSFLQEASFVLCNAISIQTLDECFALILNSKYFS